MKAETIHQGRNVKRFREMLGFKQDALAYELGDDWSQKKVSQLEQKEQIDLPILQHVANVLKIPVEAFQNFDEEQAINIISNTINNSDHATGNSLFSYYPVFNPVEKWMEALNEIKRLNAALLKEKDEKINMLERMLGNK